MLKYQTKYLNLKQWMAYLNDDLTGKKSLLLKQSMGVM
jgi:hypothetical protein